MECAIIWCVDILDHFMRRTCYIKRKRNFFPIAYKCLLTSKDKDINNYNGHHTTNYSKLTCVSYWNSLDYHRQDKIRLLNYAVDNYAGNWFKSETHEPRKLATLSEWIIAGLMHLEARSNLRRLISKLVSNLFVGFGYLFWRTTLILHTNITKMISSKIYRCLPCLFYVNIL